MFNKKQFDVYFVKFMRLLASKHLLAMVAVSILVPLVITIVFPPTAVLTEYIATRNAFFFLVMGAILLGMFNSFMVIYNERKVIRFEYMMKGLKLPTYILARAMSQFILCFAETIFMILIIVLRYKALQGHLNYQIMVFITLLLTLFASDMLGLFVSTLYKNSFVGVVIVVLIIIIQLAFGGILADLTVLHVVVRGLSYGMISKWGSTALFSIGNVFLGVQQQVNYTVQAGDKNAYIYSFPKIMMCWLVLIVLAILFAILANFTLRLVKKDKR